MAEKKCHDIYGNIYNLDSNRITHEGTVITLSTIEQSVSDTGRIGDKITVTSIEVNYSFHLPAVNSGPVPPQIPAERYILRVIIFIWKDDTTPTLADILDDTAGTTSLEQTVLAPLNHDKKVKRKIIMDEIYQSSYSPSDAQDGIDALGTNTIQQYRKVFNYTKLKGGLDTVNYQSGGTVGVNKTYILLVSNADYIASGENAINSTWNFFIRARCNYIDM